MGRELFGTDGIRGKANSEPMTAATALRVAMAAGRYFTNGDHRHLVVIGKDTRLSNYVLEPALQAGFAAMGMDVVLVGPMPTPAVAMLTRALRADLGVMISASHNPFEDNGIKLFGPEGFKLSDAVESEIEALLAGRNGPDSLEAHLAAPERLGKAWRLEDAPGRYIEYAKHSFPRGASLEGLKIVLDCAHGAACRVAPRVFRELGASVDEIGVNPNGTNINQDCGATAPEGVRRQVLESGADIGIALDGDADRVVIVDEHGRIVDGDQLMALVARSWQESGQLLGGGVVATVMSNLGLERYLEGLGLALARTRVGDRYVLEHMRRHGFNVGGEKSGHIILGDYSTTGDGVIAALQDLAVQRQMGGRMSEIARPFEPYPQLLRNVRTNGTNLLEIETVKRAMAAAEGRLGRDGRILVRPSGTEPVIRVMAEGADESLVAVVVEDIVTSLTAAAAD